MNFKFVMLLLFMFLSCNGSEERSHYKLSNIGSIGQIDLYTSCIKGIQYYIYYHGIAPSYDKYGKLVTCEEIKR